MASYDKEKLAELRALGVKTIAWHDGELAAIEFFQPAPSFPAIDFDTIVPPAPDSEEDAPVSHRTAPALARLLRNGSIS